MKWRNKKVGLSLLVTVILLSSLLSYQLGSSSVPASGPWKLHVPFSDASYYVAKFDNGTTYMVDADTWRCIWWSTNSSAVINAALGNLTSGRTWYEKVLLKADFTIDSVLRVRNYTELVGPAKITLANGADCNIIENYDQIGWTAYVRIANLWLDGNEGQQTAQSHGIYWKNPTSTGIPSKPIILENLRIQDCNGTGIFLNTTGGNGKFTINNIYSHGHAKHCLFMDDVPDSFVTLLKEHYSDEEAIWTEYCSNVHYNQIYVSGSGTGSGGYTGWVIRGNKRCSYTDIRLDNVGGHGLELQSAAYDNVFNGVIIHATNNTQANKEGILLSELWSVGPNNNTFTSGFIGYRSGSGFDIGIHEDTVNCNHNIYSSFNCMEVQVMGFNITGVNSHISASWNGTSWIDNYP